MNSSYMTPRKRAAIVRTELKRWHGWNSRDVSVTCSATSLAVTIKSVDVDPKVVAEIANQQKRIRYDERTGEILGGGNFFVDVATTRAVKQQLAQPFVAAIEAIERSDCESFPVGDCLVCNVDGFGQYIVRADGFSFQAYSALDAAVLVARNTEGGAS